MIRRRLLSLVASLAASLPVAGTGAEAERVITLGGAVTEIAFALGQGHRVVARDTTSTFPTEATALPDVGYMRALSPEGVLSLDPDLIVAAEGAGPPETLAVLQAAAVPLVIVPDDPSADGIAAKIDAVGRALDAEPEAEALSREVAARIAAARQAVAQQMAGPPVRVLFVLSAQNGRVMASGAGTAAEAIIEMAGGINAVAGFDGYKPLTDEAILAAAPEVILAMDRGGDHATSTGALMGIPAVAATPAGRAGRIVHMDGLYLLGFGPRTAEAVRELSLELGGF